VYGKAEPIFFAKDSVFSGVVSMKNESPPINLRAERKKFCENIHKVVLGISMLPFGSSSSK
jgi:hypothetical protein